MNSGSPDSNGHLRTLRRSRDQHRLEEWRQLLERCGRKPTRKRVHALRVVTLRILAQLENRIAGQGKDSAETFVAGRWIKLGENLRQALGPVREADVWLDKLNALRRSLADTNGHRVRSNKACIRQIDELKGRLLEKRRLWEKELVSEIESRRSKLESSAEKIDLAAHADPGAGAVSQSLSGVSRIREQFAGIAKEFPSLDAGNLHEFRKRIKKVRYMAEIFAGREPEAGRQASSIRKMQSAIGEWHDWQALAKREGHAHGNREELTELLETLAAEALVKALAVCERLTASVLKSGNDSHDSATVPAKKPPARSAESIGSLALENLA